MKDIFGRGGDPMQGGVEKSPQENKDRIRRYNERATKKYFKPIKGLADNQEINVSETDYSSGSTQKHKISAGEFRRRLTDAVENDEEGIKVKFDDGKLIHFDPDGSYSIEIEVVTPEVKAQEEEEEKNLKIIDGLKKEDVDTDIFFEFDVAGNRSIRYTPKQVLEIGKKIETYLEKNGGEGK